MSFEPYEKGKNDCDHLGCKLALDYVCHCKCRGKNHRTERHRNYWLYDTPEKLARVEQAIFEEKNGLRDRGIIGFSHQYWGKKILVN